MQSRVKEERPRLRRFSRKKIDFFIMLLVVRSSDSQGSQLISLFIHDEFSMKMNREDVLPICQERQKFFPAKFEE